MAITICVLATLLASVHLLATASDAERVCTHASNSAILVIVTVLFLVGTSLLIFSSTLCSLSPIHPSFVLSYTAKLSHFLAPAIRASLDYIGEHFINAIDSALHHLCVASACLLNGIYASTVALLDALIAVHLALHVLTNSLADAIVICIDTSLLGLAWAAISLPIVCLHRCVRDLLCTSGLWGRAAMSGKGRSDKKKP